MGTRRFVCPNCAVPAQKPVRSCDRCGFPHHQRAPGATLPRPEKLSPPPVPLRTSFLCMIVAALAFATLRSLGAHSFMQLAVIIIGVIAEIIYWINFIRRSNQFIKNG